MFLHQLMVFPKSLFRHLTNKSLFLPAESLIILILVVTPLPYCRNPLLEIDVGTIPFILDGVMYGVL